MNVQQELVEMVSSSGHAPAVVRAALLPGVDLEKLSMVQIYEANRNAALRLVKLFDELAIDSYQIISSTRSAEKVVITSDQLNALRGRPGIVSMVALDYIALNS